MHGFSEAEHVVDIFGLCAACAQARASERERVDHACCCASARRQARSARGRARRGPDRRSRSASSSSPALFLIDALAPTLFPASLPTRAQDGLTLAISVLIESLPFVALGVVLSIVVQVWVPPGAIERWMPRRAWARRAVLSLLGMVVPVCECGNVPFARGLMMRGFTVPETLTFLIAAPIVNPIVIITTHQAFGFSDGILIARLIGGFAIANLIGWLYSRHPDPDGLLTERFRDTCDLVVHEPGGRGRRSLAQFVIELRAVMPALVIGSALAGAVQVLIPREALLAIGSNPALSIVAMIALAMVVSICSNVDAFFALSFASTFTPGSIVAFLLVGPLVDVKMLALMRTTFTTRTLAGLVVVVILSAFAIGTVVNLLAYAVGSPRAVAHEVDPHPMARCGARRGARRRDARARPHRATRSLHQPGIVVVRGRHVDRRAGRGGAELHAAARRRGRPRP